MFSDQTETMSAVRYGSRLFAVCAKVNARAGENRPELRGKVLIFKSSYKSNSHNDQMLYFTIHVVFVFFCICFEIQLLFSAYNLCRQFRKQSGLIGN